MLALILLESWQKVAEELEEVKVLSDEDPDDAEMDQNDIFWTIKILFSPIAPPFDDFEEPRDEYEHDDPDYDDSVVDSE